MNRYINLWGLLWVVAILIPNMIFAMTCREGFVNHYQNKVVETLEQIGRFGCFFCMVIILPKLEKGFWFPMGKQIYLILGMGLVILYCLGWILFWKEDSVRKSLYLSIVPSLLFLESGVLTGSFPLTGFVVLFAPCHILISYMNAVAK